MFPVKAKIPCNEPTTVQRANELTRLEIKAALG